MDNKNKRTALADGTADNKPIITNISDDIQLLLFARHSITAATAGMRILPRDEWEQSFSNLMKKCSEILNGYAKENDNV
ncbi:MAG: hypothetical protein KZQ83_00465 [gamma proteobacterium symbiont of Taylorina sp.]|nr:hypothetical protein [gamma proteobacterium symbiont of Taylorina sp.]